jgi:hypothetical protein
MPPATAQLLVADFHDLQAEGVGKPRRHQSPVTRCRIGWRFLEAQQRWHLARGQRAELIQYGMWIKFTELSQITPAKFVGIDRAKPWARRQGAIQPIPALSACRGTADADARVAVRQFREPDAVTGTTRA